MSNTEKKEYIETEIPIIKFLNQLEWNLLENHLEIVKLLKQKNASAKEVHELFYISDGSYKVTIKTVYRWLEKLEKNNIIKMVGYRKTDRIPERLYSRSAHLYFPEPTENAKNWDLHKGKQYTDRLANILSGVIEKDFDLNEFYALFKKFSILQHQILSNILSKVEQNSILTNFYKSTHIDEINEFNKHLSTLLLILEHQTLIEKIQNLIK